MMRQQFMRKDCCVPYSGIIVLFLISLSICLFSLSLVPFHLTQAALMGGTTMVMALVLPEQHCSLVDAYEKCRALADAKACCDYALHVGVTWWGPKVCVYVKSESMEMP